MAVDDAQAEHRDASTKKLTSLEFGRGVAALAVVAHHAEQATNAFTSDRVVRVFDAGALGVDFFFVLSGFIIYHVHQRDPKSFAAAQRFLSKRLKRVYVPYWPITAVLTVAYLMLPSLSKGQRDWSLLTTITLLPTGSPPALSVAWTLVFEMMFYVFFLLFYTTHRFWLFGSTWAIATTVVAVTGAVDTIASPVAQLLLDPLTIEFIAGMLMAWLFARMSPSAWAVPAILGLGLATVYFATPGLHRVFFGIALAPLVLALALSEVSMGYKVPRFGLILGAASYAIYLVHNPLQSIVARLLLSANSWWLTFVACCVAGVTVGVSYHLIFEKPLLRLLTRTKPIAMSTVV